jgi:hypothetical protein
VKFSTTPASRLSSLARVAVPASAALIGSNAEAAIIYTDVSATITGTTEILSLDMGDGLGGTGSISNTAAVTGADFSLSYSYSYPDASATLTKPVITGTSANILADITSWSFAYQLSAGALVDATTTNAASAAIHDGNGWGTSHWVAGDSGYLGVTFQDNIAETHYGWIDLTYGLDLSLTVNGFAYESIAGQGITAGPIPEPSTAGLITALLAGSATLYRRRRSVA